MSPESARVVALACNEVGRLFDHWHSIPQGVDALCEMAVIPPLVAFVLKQHTAHNESHRGLDGWVPMSREVSPVHCLGALERFGWKIVFEDTEKVNPQSILELKLLTSQWNYLRPMACLMTSWVERKIAHGSMPRDIVPLEITLTQALLRWERVKGKTYLSDRMVLGPCLGMLLVSFGVADRTVTLKHAYGWDDCGDGVLVQTAQTGFASVGF